MKTIFNFFRCLYVFFVVRYYLLLSRLCGYEQVTFRISLLPYRIGCDIRYSFYKKMLKAVGVKVCFSFGTVVTNKNTIIGNNVRLGPFNTIGLAKFGNDILTAQYVHILSGSKQHSFSKLDIPIISQPGEIRCVEIAGDNWIGANVVVMNDVGKGTILGSGSVVTAKVPSYVVAAGNPSKILKTRK
ncbi:MAG: acyltransferase [Alteromonadales bacterium]|nr:acyltransferase [Alteromonadales bacterium]